MEGVEGFQLGGIHRALAGTPSETKLYVTEPMFCLVHNLRAISARSSKCKGRGSWRLICIRCEVGFRLSN